MTTLLEESFNRRCNVTDRLHYGYEDAPEIISANESYGYGDTGHHAPADKRGYGEGSPKTIDKYGYSNASWDDSTTKYGYGDASPNNDAAKYGYGDSSPNDDAAKYGYGDTSRSDDAAQYGYGDATPDSGSTPSSANGDADSERRPRRRNSVTRYSIVAQDAVKQEFVAHANAIDQFRQGLDSGAMPATEHFNDNFSVPSEDAAPSRNTYAHHESSGSREYASCGSRTVDNPSDDSAEIAGNKKGKSKKKGVLGRFRIGRHSSHKPKDTGK